MPRLSVKAVLFHRDAEHFGLSGYHGPPSPAVRSRVAKKYNDGGKEQKNAGVVSKQLK